MKFQVILGRCPDYLPRPELNRAIAQVLEKLEPLGLPPGARLLLKPNCLSASEGPEAPVNTRAEVVAAVGRYLVDRHQARLLIADSPGLASYGRTEKAYAGMGLDRAAQELGAELVNLERLGLVEVDSPTGLVLKKFQATALIDQVDGLVNLPKLKTHLLTGLTGAVKNYLGLLPGSLKREVHCLAPSGQAMARALVDVYSGLSTRFKLNLHVMDGLMTMEGHGPARGRPKPLGLILASPSGPALDVVVARIMGYRPGQIGTIATAAACGLGPAAEEEIDLSGGEWAGLAAPGFRRPFSGPREWLARALPRRLAGWALDRFTEARPRVNQGGCQGCGMCVAACPVGALSLDQGQGLSLDKRRCIECYCCLEHCPEEGLRPPQGWWARLRGR
jgi:uncharacterized protein (DUF362 family)/NAD-dependent dihydropyrimidine dehydrogenase PreA subunit